MTARARSLTLRAMKRTRGGDASPVNDVVAHRPSGISEREQFLIDVMTPGYTVPLGTGADYAALHRLSRVMARTTDEKSVEDAIRENARLIRDAPGLVFYVAGYSLNAFILPLCTMALVGNTEAPLTASSSMKLLSSFKATLDGFFRNFCGVSDDGISYAPFHAVFKDLMRKMEATLQSTAYNPTVGNELVHELRKRAMMLFIAYFPENVAAEDRTEDSLRANWLPIKGDPKELKGILEKTNYLCNPAFAEFVGQDDNIALLAELAETIGSHTTNLRAFLTEEFSYLVKWKALDKYTPQTFFGTHFLAVLGLLCHGIKLQWPGTPEQKEQALADLALPGVVTEQIRQASAVVWAVLERFGLDVHKAAREVFKRARVAHDVEVVTPYPLTIVALLPMVNGKDRRNAKIDQLYLPGKESGEKTKLTPRMRREIVAWARSSACADMVNAYLGWTIAPRTEGVLVGTKKDAAMSPVVITPSALNAVNEWSEEAIADLFLWPMRLSADVFKDKRPTIEYPPRLNNAHRCTIAFREANTASIRLVIQKIRDIAADPSQQDVDADETFPLPFVSACQVIFSHLRALAVDGIRVSRARENAILEALQVVEKASLADFNSTDQEWLAAALMYAAPPFARQLARFFAYDEAEAREYHQTAAASAMVKHLRRLRAWAAEDVASVEHELPPYLFHALKDADAQHSLDPHEQETLLNCLTSCGGLTAGYVRAYIAGDARARANQPIKIESVRDASKKPPYKIDQEANGRIILDLVDDDDDDAMALPPKKPLVEERVIKQAIDLKTFAKGAILVHDDDDGAGGELMDMSDDDAFEGFEDYFTAKSDGKEKVPLSLEKQPPRAIANVPIKAEQNATPAAPRANLPPNAKATPIFIFDDDDVPVRPQKKAPAPTPAPRAPAKLVIEDDDEDM